MTGETGAGKSIILGALNLVMGARADTKTITEGEDKCVIEATFVSGEDEVIIRRELNVNGRSRSFVNDEVVTQAELKALARQLIDIHSQHESLLIGDDLFQIQIIDTIANNQTELDAYVAAYEQYNEANSELCKYQEQAAKAQSDADYVAFQWQQLEDAQLQAGELEELEEEEYRLSHAEEIQSSLAVALQQLDGDNGALSLIHSIRLSDADAVLAGRIDSVEIELKDILSDIQRLYDRTELDPQRLEQVQERICMLQSLIKKHRVQTIEELIALRDEFGEQMQQLANYDEDIARLQAEVDKAHKEAEDKTMEAIGRIVEAIVEVGEEYPSSSNDKAEVIRSLLLEKAVYGHIPAEALTDGIRNRINALGRKESPLQIGTMKVENLNDIHDNKTVNYGSKG